MPRGYAGAGHVGCGPVMSTGTGRRRLEAGDLARMLASRAPALAAEMLPAGKREGHEWRCGSLAGETGRSLAVHLIGPRAGVWSDFSAGESGDALDLVAQTLFSGDVKAAMAWARQWLGLGVASNVSPQERRPVTRQAADVPKIDAEAEARRGAARRLFLAAQPELRGTPAAAYLAARGIDLAELGRQPRCLRFAPELLNRESGRGWPALVAAISSATGEHVATHRTWLHQAEAGQWTKAPLRDAKMTLGSYAGGSIRLWRGASGLPLAKARAGEAVVLAEGIETALSVAIACPEHRIMAAVSLSNMAAVILPPAIGLVIIAADDDGDNQAAARALQKAVNRFVAEGREVRLARPGIGKDFNDQLRAGEA